MRHSMKATFRPTLSRQMKESVAHNGQEAESSLTPAGRHGKGIELQRSCRKSVILTTERSYNYKFRERKRQTQRQADN
jgi:hypothetical protein